MKQQSNISFLVSAILLCVVVWAMYPFYQYYVDPDATAYFTIVKRYLAEDFHKAINGYWSPWSCWLTVDFSWLSGWSLMASAVAVNTIGAVGFLFITHSFLSFFNVTNALQWLVKLTLVVFLSYAVYGQLFDDLWECFFLLSTLRLMLREDFKRKVWLWVVVGLLGCLAYFAKAYAFPFFILNTIVCTYFISDNKAQWLKISVVSIIVMIVGSMPWIVALHGKYGEWMTGTAGKLNLSWYTVGHPYWKQGITHLIPPAYGDSPYYWEDPYMVNGATPNAFSSLAMLKMQLIRIPFNIFKFVRSMSEVSALFIVIFGVMLMMVLSKKTRRYFPDKMHITAVSFLLFPLGYVLINFEARYLWYMLPLGLVMGALLLEILFLHFNDSKWIKPKAYLLFALSFIYFPVLELKKMYKVGAEDHRIAVRMQGLNGSFTAITQPGEQVQGIERIAYFSGNTFYPIINPKLSHEELLAEMKRYGVKYYIYFYNSADGNNYSFTDAKGQQAQEVLRDEAYGIRVFRVPE